MWWYGKILHSRNAHNVMGLRSGCVIMICITFANPDSTWIYVFGLNSAFLSLQAQTQTETWTNDNSTWPSGGPGREGAGPACQSHWTAVLLHRKWSWESCMCPFINEHSKICLLTWACLSKWHIDPWNTHF